MSKVTVIDSVMGSGKTSWAIQYMNANVDENILYVTPFLNETERIQSSVNKKEILLPKNLGEGKSSNLIDLFASQGDIAATHELFKRMTKDCLETISAGEYTLILDETLEAVQPYIPRSKDDITFLRERDTVVVDEDGFLQWNDKDFTTSHDEVKALSKNHCLFYVDDHVLMWRFPPEIFNVFNKIYVMTYMFDGTIMKSYFDMCDIKYDMSSITKAGEIYELCPYKKSDNSIFRNKINIYNGRMNSNISDTRTAFSSTWYKSSYNKTKTISVKKNILNYFRNIAPTSSEFNMWTTFKYAKEKLKGKGYTKGFVSYNQRATNEYQYKTTLAYCVNLYVNPGILHFFNKFNVKFDQDKYALSEMLQWIWRSNIRMGGRVNIFIQSNRMRELLTGWLNNKY